MDAPTLSDEVSLQRAIAQQLAALSAAGVQQVGAGKVLSVAQPESNPTTETATPVSADLATPAVTDVPANTTQIAGRDTPAPTDAQPQPLVQTPVTTDAATQLKVLSQTIAECTLCDELCANRTQTVFGVGNPNARL